MKDDHQISVTQFSIYALLNCEVTEAMFTKFLARSRGIIAAIKMRIYKATLHPFWCARAKSESS